MVAIGEQGGKLDEMTAHIADHYERRINEWVGKLNSLLEPLIMMVLGLVVGGLIIAMYLPIFQLGAQIG